MVANESAAYVLKSCLSGEALRLTKNVDDDIDEMWRRLEDRFPISKITSDIMSEIRRVKRIMEGEPKRFSEFVNLVEGSFRDLERIDMQAEISNTTVVGMIEEKLPGSIFNAWCLEVCEEDSTIDDRHKFKDLLKFLLKHKRAVEYGSHESRTTSTSARQGQTHYGQGNSISGPKINREREVCWIHGNNSFHPIWKCNEFFSKSVEERIKIATEHEACHLCLLTGCPGSIDTKQSKSGFRCLEKGCGGSHNLLLHMAKFTVEGTSSHAESWSSNEVSSGGTILPIQKL